MKKKPLVVAPSLQWSPKLKEPWFVELEKEAVNDERWTCLVTAAVQAEPQDEEYIQIFNQYAATGLRRAIKTITMADVVSLIKGSDVKKPEEKNNKTEKSKKSEKIDKVEKKSLEPSPLITLPPPRYSEIVSLAAKYATFTDYECKLAPDLMAAVLKYLILNLKEENRLHKRIDAARERKRRNQKIKSDFKKSLKPFEVELVTSGPACSQEPIQDEPFGGPDLYILLSDFYEPFCFLELLKMNTPFAAILKISKPKSVMKEPQKEKSSGKANELWKKKSQVGSFWEKLEENCSNVKTQNQFADIAFIQYEVSKSKEDLVKSTSQTDIFDGISRMLYSVYHIYRQHQSYLQSLLVQRMVLSLEPLDLSLCKVYNKLCDALVTGEAITSCLVLYAMIEQVVAGVPDTESIPIEYKPKPFDFFPTVSPSEGKLDDGKEFQNKSIVLMAPCLECRDKKPFVCGNEKSWEKQSSDYSTQENGEWCESSEKDTKCSSEERMVSKISPKARRMRPWDECCISESLMSRVLTESRTETETHQGKRWVSPRLYLYGDTIELQTYHCDPRIINPTALVDRFMKNSNVSLVWEKYPKLSREKTAFYNFHFLRLRKISKKPQELMKLNIHFLSVMQLVGAIKFFLHKGVMKNVSDIMCSLNQEKFKPVSKVKIDENVLMDETEEKKTFCKFFRLPISDFDTQPLARNDTWELLQDSNISVDPVVFQKMKSQISLVSHRNSGSLHFYTDPFSMLSAATSPEEKKEYKILLLLLNCFEISNLVEHNFFLNKEDITHLVGNFKFYENLEPRRMLQRLLEIQEDYNTVLWSYVTLTDTLLILMFNDHNHRGLFFNDSYGILLTPVGLKDFCSYIYPRFTEWVFEEKEKYEDFIREEQERAKELKAQIDEEYLLNLKKHYCGLNEEEKKIYITEQPTPEELEVREEDLKDLPLKPRYENINKKPITATNIKDIQVEIQRKVQEYHSKDETEVDVIIDSWVYDPQSLLTVSVKKSGKKLTYYQQLYDKKTNTTFSFTTSSGIIFLFYKANPGEYSTLNYNVTISWPTGLMIQGVSSDGNFYVRQSYLRVYRQGWKIQEEKSRCFLRNGQILVFKENGDVEVLHASGTRCRLYDSVRTETVPDENDENSQEKASTSRTPLSILRYEVTTTTGEVLQKSGKHPRRNKKKVVSTQKVYIGVDENTKETFYKREDGVQCMLWPDGKLVTSFPDGTKITSTPDFDKTEIFIEWTEEEKTYFSKIKTECREKKMVEEKTASVLVKELNDTETDDVKKELESDDGYVSVSCSYLMEHPKYSSVYFDSNIPSLLVKMPKELSIEMTFEGNYVIRQESIVLTVEGSTIEFYNRCCKCNRKSVATLTTESAEYLCQFVDLYSKVFYVYKNGQTSLQDLRCSISEEKDSHQKCNDSEVAAINLRCFAFERDLSGVEFLQADALARYVYHLSPETHFELHSNTEKDSIPFHTFTRPLYEIGFEKWVMEYENKSDSLPEKLKKNDLKELGVKEKRRNLFKYPFPKYKQGACNAPRTESLKLKMPKVIETRIINCISSEPLTLISEMRKYFSEYQKMAYDICERYKKHQAAEKVCREETDVQSKLENIALAFSQSFREFPHLCMQVPSVEKEIHYFGHFIEMMETYRSHTRSDSDCKQIPHRLPKPSNFESIYESEKFTCS